MLELIRTKQKSMVVKLVFWVIIAAFVGTIFLVWGKGRDSGPAQSNLAAEINGTEISYAEYQQAYSNLYNLYQSIYRENFTPELEKRLNLGQQAIDQLTQEVLLMQEADRLGLSVSKQELVEAIAQYAAFQENGAFNRDRYLQVLNYQRLTPEQFEATQSRQLLTDKVRQLLQQGVEVLDEEIDQTFHEENDKVNLNFVSLAPALFETKVKVDEEKLKAYFAAQQENFRLPEMIALRYLQFDPARYEKEIGNFAEEDLERHYRRNLDLFEIKEQVKASHILIRVASDADDQLRQQKQELAASLLKQLKEGKDFAELARANSDDPGSAAKGGDLGYFTRGVMVAAFDAAAFALQPGQLSEVVETPFGYHIIKVEEYIEPGVEPLADAMDKVKAGLKVELARKLAYEKAMDAYNINRKSGDLDAAAASNDLGVKETGFFGRDDAIDGIGRETAISAAAFSLQPGQLARPVQTTQGIFLLSLKERKESRLPELDEVRAAVEQAYRQQQAKELAASAAAELLSSAKELKSLRQAAAKHGFKLEETDFFSRSYGAFIPRIGSVEELAEAAFALTSDAPIGSKVYTQGEKYLVISLKQAQPGDLSSLDDAKRQEIKDRLLTQKKEAAVTSKLEELRNQSQITLAPELVRTLGNGRS